MKFAIIAAGEGSRLAQEGVEEPKPLVSVCDQPMIERLMRIFVDCGASEIVVIINKEIAERLNLSLPTVVSHRKNVMAKLGIHSVSALTIYAVMHGLVDVNEI